ncbi:MAG: AAA family ATPase, partial [Gemmataceae bacterium]
MPGERGLKFDMTKALQSYSARSTGAIRRIDAEEMASALRERVRGQDHVVNDLAKLIRTNWGKQTRTRPIASILCLGPPGTGKSELAKALAQYLYADEKNALVFDGPDLSGPEAKTHLLGTPVGFVGSDSGGKLTRPIINNPRQVIVFEEVEKAYKDIFDLFLAM